MRSKRCLRLSFGTGLERTAPESLIGPLYAFVHGHILLTDHSLLLDRGPAQFAIASNAIQRLTATSQMSQSAPHVSGRNLVTSDHQKNQPCITMGRLDLARLSSGTSLERTAPESLTQRSCGFVHGDIWIPCRISLPHRVGAFRFIELFHVELLTPRGIRNAASSQGPRSRVIESARASLRRGWWPWLASCRAFSPPP